MAPRHGVRHAPWITAKGKLLKSSPSSYPVRPDSLLTREFQVWMKFIFKLLAIDRCTTSTCQIRRQEASQLVPRSTPHGKNYGSGSKDSSEYTKGKSSEHTWPLLSILQLRSPAAGSSTDIAHSDHWFHSGKRFLFKITPRVFFPGY